MKRFICITIALCLVFGSICPVFGAVQDVNISSYNPNGNFATLMASVIATIVNLNTNFQNWATLTGTGGSGIGATFQDLAITLAHIDNWFAPAGSNSMGGTLVELIANMGTIVAAYMPYLSDLPNIATYVYNWMNTNNTNLNNLAIGLTNFYKGSGANTWSFDKRALNGHYTILDGDGKYWVYGILDNGQTQSNKYNWGYGSPIGNLALLLQNATFNQTYAYRYRWIADLKHYNDQLSTWDSAGNNGNTLEQVLFTPESAIQGLYRYLAFTQRDVARLTFTLANEKDQQMRESTEDQQDQLYDSFLNPGDQSNPAASGRVSDNDIGDMGDLSAGFKDNMNTGVSASNIWSVFDSSRYNWFTQATKNSLDTVPATRNVYDTSDYPTPLLDAYYSEMFSILGVDIDESR